MQELDLQDMSFQQDNAICHTACVTMDILGGEFGEHLNWPPRSCDLTPLDFFFFFFFLWGCVKSHGYTDKPASFDALKENIEAFICEIPAEMLKRVCKNWTKRMK